MKTALFTSYNLIGDGLEISGALQAWHAEHLDWYIFFLTHNNHITELYRGMGVPLTVVYERPAVEFDFEFIFDINKAFIICDQEKCPMAVGYARLLGVTLGEKQKDVGPFYDPPIVAEDDEWVERVPQGTILIAPFSNSCTSHDGKPPNKCLPWLKWKGVLRYLRTLGGPIRVTGSAKERADELGMSEEEYLTGIPLRPLARAMKERRISLVVSVDNGISHLTGSQHLDHILYYPLCLGLHYAVPWGNPFCIPIHMDPAQVEAVQVLWTTKQAIKHLEVLHEKAKAGGL